MTSTGTAEPETHNPDYGIILPSGELIGGTLEGFPKRLVQRLHKASSDPEREMLLGELLAFYTKQAPEQMVAEDWLSLAGCISDLSTRARVLLACGGSMERSRCFPAAAAIYREVVRVEPLERHTWYYAHNNLGFCLNQLRDFAAGEASCRAALRIDAGLPNAHKNLGLALRPPQAPQAPRCAGHPFLAASVRPSAILPA